MADVSANIPKGMPKVVLFGRANSGKSALLGALAREAVQPSSALNGTLVDKSGRLEQLTKGLGSRAFPKTEEEIVAYPVAYHPTIESVLVNYPTIEVVLLDCAGDNAQELLTDQEKLVKGSRTTQLANAVLDADALILVLDGNCEDDELYRNFEEFNQFLLLIGKHRSDQNEVAGLPVFLVLTKSDQFASRLSAEATEKAAASKKEESLTPDDWINALEARKKEIERKFRKAFRANANALNSFGELSLTVWATAAQRPKIGAHQTKSESYGVAELFRQCFRAAYEFHQRRRETSQRLNWIVGGALAMVAGMLFLAVIFFTQRENVELNKLRNNVDTFFASRPNEPAEKVYKYTEEDIQRLKKFKDDPAYELLYLDTREQIQTRLRKLQAFEEYYTAYKKFRVNNKMPENVSSLERLQKLENELDKVLAKIPEKYAVEWSGLPSVQTPKEMAQTIKTIESKVRETQKKYVEAKELLKDVVKIVNDQGARAAHDKAVRYKSRQDELTNITPNDLVWNSTVSWSVILNFQEVQNAKDSLETYKKQKGVIDSLNAALRAS